MGYFSAAASPGQLEEQRPTAGAPALGQHWSESGTPLCHPKAAWVWICSSWAVPSRICTAGQCRPAGTASRKNRWVQSQHSMVICTLVIPSWAVPVGCWWTESCGTMSRPRPVHSPALSWSPHSGSNCEAPSLTGWGHWAGSLGSTCCCLHGNKSVEETARRCPWRLPLCYHNRTFVPHLS